MEYERRINELKQNEESLRTSSERMANLEQQYEIEKLETVRQKSRANEKEEQIAALLAQLDRSKSELKVEKDKSLKIQQEFQEKEKRLVNNNDKSSDKSIDLQKVNAKLTHELRSTKEQLQREKEKVKTREVRVTEAVELENKAKEISDSQSETSHKLKEKLKQSEKELQTEKHKNQAMENKAVAMQEELEKLRRVDVNINELKTQIHQVENENDLLRKRNAENKQEIQNLMLMETDGSQLDKRVIQENFQLRKKNEALNKENLAYHEKIEKQKKLNRELEGALEKIKAKENQHLPVSLKKSNGFSKSSTKTVLSNSTNIVLNENNSTDTLPIQSDSVAV